MAHTLTDPVDGILRTARQLMHDRDPLYTRVFGKILTSGDVGPLWLPPQSPNLNADAEWFVRWSIKEETSIALSRSARGIYASSSTSTLSMTIVRDTTRDSTTSSCNDRHRR